MDDFVNTFLSSSSWTDVTSPESISWVGTSTLQTNSTVHGPLDSESYRIINEQNSTMCMISSDETIQTVPIHESNLCGNDEDAAVFVDENLALNRDILSLESQLQQGISGNITLPTPQHGIHRSFNVPGSLEDNAAGASFASHCNGNFAREQSIFPQSLNNSNSISTIPQLWPSSCSSIHSLATRQNNLQIMASQEGFVDNSANPVDGTFGNNERSQVNMESPKSHISTVTPISGINMTRDIGTQPNDYQMIHSINGNFAPMTQAQCSPGGANCSNGAAKPRMRARRGQATDPHSIAERLRREKIADRMKNLQELVPNANKMDKASMLDEIIDYVKFLQLQVKVLSMSRVGAAGAVVPLISDVQSEESSNMLSSPTVVFRGTDISYSEDDVAFEQEVVKLMETDLTAAMQLLQTKGLCFMPVALASAISARKGVPGAIPMERQNPDSSPEVMSSRSVITWTETTETKQVPRSCNGSVATLESAQNLSSGSTSDLKPKA